MIKDGLSSEDAIKVLSSQFSLLGLPMGYILDDFIEGVCGGRSNLEGKTTNNVKDQFLLGLTASSQLSLCEQLLGRNDARVCNASWFISHAWQCKFLDVIDAMMDFFRSRAQTEDEAMGVVVWFDLFSNSQHKTDERPFEWWQGTFTNAIREMGNVLQVLTPWEHPIPLKRAWCVFEIYACECTNSNFHVTMTSVERTRFMEMLLKDGGEYYKMLAKVDAEKSESFLAADRERIHDAIRRILPGGFVQLNNMILTVYGRWMLQVLQSKVEEAINSRSELDEAKYKNSLATLYENQGKYAEAEPLYVDCLRLRRQLLGENNPDTLSSMNNLAVLYCNRGKYAEAEPLYVDFFKL